MAPTAERGPAHRQPRHGVPVAVLAAAEAGEQRGPQAAAGPETESRVTAAGTRGTWRRLPAAGGGGLGADEELGVVLRGHDVAHGRARPGVAVAARQTRLADRRNIFKY